MLRKYCKNFWLDVILSTTSDILGITDHTKIFDLVLDLNHLSFSNHNLHTKP